MKKFSQHAPLPTSNQGGGGNLGNLVRTSLPALAAAALLLALPIIAQAATYTATLDARVDVGDGTEDFGAFGGFVEIAGGDTLNMAGNNLGFHGNNSGGGVKDLNSLHSILNAGTVDFAMGYGCALTVNTIQAANVTIADGNTLTLNGGTISSGGSITATDTGTLIVNGGTFTHVGVSAVNGGITIDGGAFAGSGRVSTSGSGNIAISDGTFSGKAVEALDTGNITISGTAYFNSSSVITKDGLLTISGDAFFTCNSDVATTGSGDIAISGGTFNSGGLSYRLNVVTSGSGNITISDGTFDDILVYTETTGNIDITGGTFTNDTSVTTRGSGNIAISDGMFDNTPVFTWASGDITIDGGSFDGGYIVPLDGGDLVITDGTFTGVQVGMDATMASAAMGSPVAGTKNVTISGGTFTDAAVTAMENITISETSGTAEFSGGSVSTEDGTIAISGGTFTNGTAVSTSGSGDITISGGAFDGADVSTKGTGNIDISDGTFKNIFVWADGSGNITIDGGKFDSMGVGAETGALTITNGEFINTGVYTNGSGVLTVEDGTFTGCGIIPLGDGEVNIKGGTFSGYVEIGMDAETASTELGYAVAGTKSVVISGGTFNDGTTKVMSEGTIAITTAGNFGDVKAKGDVTLGLTGGNNADTAALTMKSLTTGGDIKITGSGAATLGIVTMNGNNKTLTIGNGVDTTMVGFDVVQSVFSNGSTVDVQTGATLGAYGGTKGKDETIDVSAWTMGGAVESWDKNGDWTYDDINGLLIFGALAPDAGIKMSAGFAQALTIHDGQTAWKAVHDKMISGNDRQGLFRAQCDPCDPVCGGVARNAWANYVGRSDRAASDFANHTGNWRLSSEGVQAGTDLYRSRSGQFGVLFGYEGARMRNNSVFGGVSSLDRVAMDDVYSGFYGTKIFRGGADARVIFAYGQQDYDMDRADFDGIYKSSFKGYTTETNLELGKRFYNGAWSYRPVMGLDIFNNNIKSATETGPGVLGVAYNKASLTQTFFRFGTDLRYHSRNFTLNSGIYYSYDMHGQALTAMTNQGLLVASKPGRELITANLGVEFQVSNNMSLFGGYQGEYTPDRTTTGQVQSIGYAGAGWKW